MDITIEEATKIVEAYLSQQEVEMNNFGSALPGYVNPNHSLQIQPDQIQVHEFGWVFFYNTKKYIESGEMSFALGGNSPVIVDRKTAELITTGTSKDISYYITNYANHGDPHKQS